jgi:NAD(P)-dependent dehydrogenase (short-subunit alcohol dehydrogenase family)
VLVTGGFSGIGQAIAVRSAARRRLAGPSRAIERRSTAKTKQRASTRRVQAASAKPGAAVVCDHLHDTTSRYDAAEKVLTFLRVCRICAIEQVVQTLEYEPKPVWAGRGAARQLTGGATGRLAA